jgi:hypothetical protein
MAGTFTLFNDNDQYIQLTGLYSLSKDALGNLTVKSYESGATVTATLNDVSGNPVDGLNGINLLYVDGSQGTYRGQVGADFSPALGAGLYTLVVVAVASLTGGQLELTLNVPVTVVQRTTQ